jgi:uncharacterized membrane-anchored protein
VRITLPKGLDTGHGAADDVATAKALTPGPLESPPRKGGLATAPNSGGIRGPARLGRRTKELTQRLAPGAVAVLDHADLDSVAARGLLACRPAAVVNRRPFVTGRYPNRGPGILLDAGVPLFDLADPDGPDPFEVVADGEPILIRDSVLCRADGAPVAGLVALTPDGLASRLADARTHLDAELSSFVSNTLRYLAKDEERALLLDPVAVPEVRTPIAGRAVLVVVRGDGYEEDLQRLAPYISEQRPIVIAVDGAADALLARGIRPHLLLGDMDSVRDETLRCGAELIVHAYARPGLSAEEAAPGLTRLRSLGLDAQTFPVAGTSEDAALLLAHEKGADLIVAVGTHTHLEDFLDKGRGGMASTFLVRLKVGSRLVDARGVSRLYTGRQRMGGLLTFLAVSALFPVVVLLASTPQGQVAWRSVVVWFRLLFNR